MRTQDQSECQPTFHRTGPIDTMVAKNVKAGLILGSTVIDTTWTRPLVEPVDDAATVELLSIGNLRMLNGTDEHHPLLNTTPTYSAPSTRDTAPFARERVEIGSVSFDFQ